MQDLRNIVLGLGPLPLWAWIVLGVVILLGCAFLIWQLWRFGARRAGVPEEAVEEAPKPANAFLPQAIREAFLDAHRWLRSVFPGRDYRYAAPVFLMIGESGAGKSTLLRSVSMGRALRESPGSEPVNWYFFDRGAIIDSRGDVLGMNEDLANDSGPWDTLIQAFQRYRAERPLDGLILVVPVTDFVGPARLSKEELNAKAEALHRRIGRLQNRVGMQLPIYLVLSKCDALEGFAAAADLFSQRTRDEALGWSSPYSPDSAFVPTWTGEAIDTIYHKVSEAIVEAMAVAAEERESGQAFLFPGAIRRLEEGLRPFLADLLRVSAYNRSGSLRGIFLTGAPLAGQAREEFAVRDVAFEAGSATPIFARGLLDKKIFPEYALARPFSLSLLSSNRNVRIAQGAMAALLVLAVVGVWYADNWLTRTTRDLGNVAEGVLRKVRSLDDARAAGLRPDQKLLEQSTLPLLLSLGEADRRDLISLVVPGSWISSLPGEVDRMLDRAFQVILFQSMHDSLVARLQNLNETETAQPPDTTAAATNRTATAGAGGLAGSRQFAPYPDYGIVLDFVADLQALTRNIDLYNSLRTTDSTFAVSSVVEYLYGLQLSDQFFANVGAQLFEGARGRITPIDVASYRPQARDVVAGLAQAFYADLQDRYGLLQNARQLVRLIDQTGVSREPIASLQILKQTETLALQVRSSVQSGRYDWALGPQLELGPSFDSMLDRVKATPLLGSDVADAMQSHASQIYTDFRNDLLQTVSRAIGPIFVENNGSIVLSPALQELDQRLNGLPTLLAATATGTGFAATELPASPPPGSYIVWDIQQLEDAVDASRRLANLELQAVTPGAAGSGSSGIGVGRIINREIAGRLVSSVAEAATLQRLPFSSGSIGYESLVARRVQNFSEAAVRLDRIISFFDALGADEYRNQIQRLQAQSAYSILQGATDLLDQTGAYEPRNGDFSWWDGKAGAAFEAYGVSGQSELTGYLGLQRQRITYIAQNYAEPVLVYLLNLRVDVAGVDVHALTRWTGISQDISRYQAKVPDNPLVQLENYVQGPMAQVSADNCQPAVADLSGADNRDFFLAKLASLSSAFAARCFSMADLQVADGYNQISNAFNRNLAGSFPFATAVPVASQGGEVSMAATLRFLNQFNVYMNQGAGDPSRWANVPQDVRQPALQFLNQMDAVNELFAAGMTGQGAQASFEYDLQVAFRVERQLEIGAAQLVEWSLTSGSTKVDQFTAANRVPWKFGDPITVAFTWALNGQTRPTRGQDVPANFVIADRTASFEYKGDWALFELVAAQRMAASLRGPDSGSGGSVLQFEVPIEPFTDPSEDSSPIPADKLPKAARLFIEITVFGSKQQGSPRIAVPDFPVSAPAAKAGTVGASAASTAKAAPAAAAPAAAAPVAASPAQAQPSAPASWHNPAPAAAPAQSGGTAGAPRRIYPTGTGSGTSAGGHAPSAMTMYDVWRDSDPGGLSSLDPIGAGLAAGYPIAAQPERGGYDGRPWREPPPAAWSNGGWGPARQWSGGSWSNDGRWGAQAAPPYALDERQFWPRGGVFAGQAGGAVPPPSAYGGYAEPDGRGAGGPVPGILGTAPQDGLFRQLFDKN